MANAFDPYRKWLAIPAEEQPPHYYRLLAIPVFEADPDVISNAADGRMSQIKSFQTGPYGKLSQHILNQISAAKICLLDPQKKAAYDRQLEQHLTQTGGAKTLTCGAASAHHSDPSDLSAFNFSAEGAVSARRQKSAKRSQAKKQPWPIYAAVGGGLVAAVAALSFILHANSPADDVRTASNPPPGADPQSKRDVMRQVKTEPKPRETSLAKVQTKAANSTDPGNRPVVTPAATKPQLEMAVDAGDEPKPDTKSAKQSQLIADVTLPQSKTEQFAVADPAQEAKSPSPNRLSVPDKPLQQAAEAKVREVFKEEFAAAKTSDARAALAKKLLAQADGSKDDAAAYYVLLKMAGDQAVLAGDVARAMDVIDKMSDRYQFAAASKKADVLAAMMRASSLETTTASAVFDAAMKLCDEAVARDDFDLAGRLAKAAGAAARRFRDAEQNRLVLVRLKEIDQMKSRFAVVQKALDTLQGNAADGAANLVAGQWYCFTKGGWGKGLPMLAKGNREDLAELARQDLAPPSEAKQQTALGDAWWGLGEKESAAHKPVLQGRARHWYQIALPKLAGLDKARVEKRLESSVADSEPALPPGAKLRGGAVQRGNVALASNGTVVSGNIQRPEELIDGNTTRYDEKNGFAYGTWPFDVLLTLRQVYQLQEIRFKTYDRDPRLLRYVVSTSMDGKNFTVVADLSKTPSPCGWQRVTFPPRLVKVVKLDCLEENKNHFFHIVEVEAYCTRQTAPK